MGNEELSKTRVNDWLWKCLRRTDRKQMCLRTLVRYMGDDHYVLPIQVTLVFTRLDGGEGRGLMFVNRDVHHDEDIAGFRDEALVNLGIWSDDYTLGATSELVERFAEAVDDVAWRLSNRVDDIVERSGVDELDVISVLRTVEFLKQRHELKFGPRGGRS